MTDGHYENRSNYKRAVNFESDVFEFEIVSDFLHVKLYPRGLIEKGSFEMAEPPKKSWEDG